MSAPYPPTFLWGTATAGHQNEGGDVDADTTFLESVSPTVFREKAGLACNGYELWETDLDLVAALGLNAYRFSVEWSRIEPRPGEISEEALRHYDAVVDGCLARGLAPLVTFSHFTAPHWFAQRGAWLDAEAPQLFAGFCDTVMRRFGDRIAMAITLNEPNLYAMLSWAGMPPEVHDLERATLEAASTAAGVERYRTANVVLVEEFDVMRDGLAAAHVAAKAAIKAVRPDLPVGFSLAMTDDVALPGGEEIVARKRAEVYDFWLRLAAADDFLGVQNYERYRYDATGRLPAPEGASMSDMGSALDADSLRGAVVYAHQVSGVPILVSEHGVATHDDSLRLGLLEPALDGLAEAMNAGVPVLGYCHWTLMDNFEWVFGFHGELGLHSVDRTTFERTRKPSADEYARLVARRRAVR